MKQLPGRPRKLKRHEEKNILKTVFNNPNSSTRVLALDMKNDCGVDVSHETVRKVLLNHKYSSCAARKKVSDSSKFLKKATHHILYPTEYWDDVIFSR